MAHSPTEPRRRAEVRPVAGEPPAVAGVGFQPDEVVTVRVMGGGRVAGGQVTASPEGTWSLPMPSLGSGPVQIRATGSRGSVAAWTPRAIRIPRPPVD